MVLCVSVCVWQPERIDPPDPRRPDYDIRADVWSLGLSLVCRLLQFSTVLCLFISCCTHTHTHLTALCPGLPSWAGTRKVKPIWILLKQETVSRSGISWAICKSAPCSRQITMPAPPPLRFLQARCLSCRPTNSVKALKAVSCCIHALKRLQSNPLKWIALGPNYEYPLIPYVVSKLDQTYDIHLSGLST